MRPAPPRPVAGAPAPSLLRTLPFAVRLLLLGALTAACGGDDDASTPDPVAPRDETIAPSADDGATRADRGDLDDAVRRDLAAALYAEDRPDQAAEMLRPLVERDDALVSDIVDMAIVQVARENGLDAAWEHIERAHALAPDDPAKSYVRGLLLMRYVFEPEQAIEELQRVVAANPDDHAGHYQLAQAYNDSGRYEEALPHYERVRGIGVERAGAFYTAATYALSRVQLRLGRRDLYDALTAEYDALKDEEAGGPGTLDDQTGERGLLGRLIERPPTPLDAGRANARNLAAWVEVATLPLSGADALHLADVDDDGLVDVLARDGEGLSLARQTGPATFVAETLPTEGRVLSLDVGELHDEAPPSAGLAPPADSPRELLIVEAGGDADAGMLVLLEREGDAWTRRLLGEDRVTSAFFSDFDHDGLLDVVATTADRGLRLLRGNGDAGFTDATPAAAAALGACSRAHPEDVDIANDVDYFVVTDAGLAVLANLRSGAFEDRTDALGVRGQRGVIDVCDLDADSRPDLVIADGATLSWRRNTGERFEPARALLDVSTGGATGADADAAAIELVDLDGDLALDARLGARAWPGPLPLRESPPAAREIAGLAGDVVAIGDVIGARGPRATTADKPSETEVVPALMDLADYDTEGWGRLEAVVADADGVRLLSRAPSASPGGFSLELIGDKDNQHGVGALVETRVGNDYRRVYWRGDRRVIGLGEADAALMVRVTWPNGVVQRLFDVPRGISIAFVQVERLSGSCPFLYTWNGETFTFVTDVLGATPLGLPMAPGVFVPFDHEEYVKITGEQLRPDEDGRLRIALTEELREVTYLDRVRLHVIDHPAGTDVEPNEAFTFPPFPPHHVHTLTDVLRPARAIANLAGTGADGYGALDADDVDARGGSVAAVEDVTERLGARDDRHARPFVTYDHRLLGLCEPWSLDLEFGATAAERDAIRAAPKLRLMLTGWLQWGNASVNLAAAAHPRASFDPPTLWVPDGERAWRRTGPPIGFPAGKTKTMLVDVTDLLDRDDPRLRLTTTLELSWDVIALVIDADDAPYDEHLLEPLAADLSFRGFSRLILTGREDLPELFDWNDRYALHEIPWNQHPGRYTRYGDVAPLLDAVDDRTVIMGAGDVIEIAFDGRALPALPDGWRRDYLLYLDGWAKDGDPNTAAATTVEPLPFHGMGRYPPPADGRRFPATDAELAWDREWNTREGRRLIEPMVVESSTATRR